MWAVSTPCQKEPFSSLFGRPLRELIAHGLCSQRTLAGSIFRSYSISAHIRAHSLYLSFFRSLNPSRTCASSSLSSSISSFVASHSRYAHGPHMSITDSLSSLVCIHFLTPPVCLLFWISNLSPAASVRHSLPDAVQHQLHLAPHPTLQPG